MERAAALDYHERTKHSYESIHRSPHFLDWDNQPVPFKIYRGGTGRPLPPVEAPSGRTTFEALRSSDGDGADLTAAALSRLLFHAAGITKHIRSAAGEMAFRAAACTGALYHIDLYLVSGEIDDLAPGVHHYDPRHHALTTLRAGDWRSTLSRATAGEEHVSRCRAAVVLTSTYWRNAWKYRERAYRHAFWDGGTILANLFAEARALGVDAHLALGFVDSQIERLLGIDAAREGALAIVALSRDAKEPSPAPGPMEPLALETEPLSAREVDYPAIRETHAATSLEDAHAVTRFRDGVEALPAPPASGSERALSEGTPSSELPLETVIRRRGSARRFLREPIELEQLGAILASTDETVSCDAFPAGATWSERYVIVNDVRGLEPGAYHYRAQERKLELLKRGELRREASHLDLGQDLAGDASANVYVLVDLESILARLGERGYRAAQLEGGILGGRMYLAAYALGLGATGLTFFDDAVTEFFSPHAAGKAVLFLVALGVPGKRRVLYQK